MKSKYDAFTEEKRNVSYEQNLFLTTALRKLGFKPANNGTIYLKKIIILAYKERDVVINLKELCNKLSKKLGNVQAKTIYENIKYAVNNINYNKARANYEIIFNIPYDNDYFTTRNIIEEFINILEFTEQQL